MADDLHNLFTESEEDPMVVDIPALTARSKAFEATIRRRNFIEVFAGGIVVASFGAMALASGTWLDAVGPLLTCIGAVYVTVQIYRRGDSPAVEATATSAEFVAGHKQALLYQADLLRSVGTWYIGPLLPGFFWMMGARLYRADPGSETLTVGAIALLSALVFAGVWWMNLAAAKKLRAEAESIGFAEEMGS